MTTLELSQIRTDGGTQSRTSMYGHVVYEYADAMKEGVRFPPITVFFDGTDYWLADGFHRLSATKEAGFKEIIADVKEGTQRDAVLYSVGANATHGLMRTTMDKRKAVETLLKDEEWGKWSDREIARRAGVDNKTVARYRALLSEEIPRMDRQITRNGTTYTMKQRHWSEVTPMAFWDKVKKYGLPADESLIGAIQKKAAKLSDLTMTKDEALEALRKLAVAYHSQRFPKGSYVKHRTGRFGKVREVMADALDVFDLKNDMQDFWQIDGCEPSTEDEWITTAQKQLDPEPPQPAPTKEPKFKIGDWVHVKGKSWNEAHGTVQEVRPAQNGALVKLDKGMISWFNMDELAPVYQPTSVTEPKPAPMSDLKNGQTVKTKAGHIGTITGFVGRFVIVQTVNGAKQHLREHLEPYEQPELTTEQKQAQTMRDTLEMLIAYSQNELNPSQVFINEIWALVKWASDLEEVMQEELKQGVAV